MNTKKPKIPTMVYRIIVYTIGFMAATTLVEQAQASINTAFLLGTIYNATLVILLSFWEAGEDK